MTEPKPNVYKQIIAPSVEMWAVYYRQAKTGPDGRTYYEAKDILYVPVLALGLLENGEDIYPLIMEDWGRESSLVTPWEALRSETSGMEPSGQYQFQGIDFRDAYDEYLRERQ